MNLFKHHASCVGFSAFLLLLASCVCPLNGEIIRGIVKKWSKADTVVLEYQEKAFPGTKNQRAKFEANKDEQQAKLFVEIQCYEIESGENLRYVLLKSHKKGSSPEPAYTLDVFDITGECNQHFLKERTYILKNTKKEFEDKETVQEVYEVMFKVLRAGNCYKRVYTVSQTDLEVTVTRDEPTPVSSEDCEEHLQTAQAGSGGTFHNSWSPSGTYHQTEFDQSKDAITVSITNGQLKTEIICRDTEVSRLRVIPIANVSYKGLIIDRFEVALCHEVLLKSSIMITPSEDAPKVTFKTGDTCYERSYKIELNGQKTTKIPEYKVTKSSETKISACPSALMAQGPVKLEEEKPEKYVRYIVEW